MAMSSAPQLQLTLPNSFKRSFEQLGFDIDSESSPAEGSSGGSSEQRKRARSSSQTSVSTLPPRIPTPDVEMDVRESSEGYRIEMERFEAFDSQIAVLRRTPTPPPTLPPLVLDDDVVDDDDDEEEEEEEEEVEDNSADFETDRLLESEPAALPLHIPATDDEDFGTQISTALDRIQSPSPQDDHEPDPQPSASSSRTLGMTLPPISTASDWFSDVEIPPVAPSPPPTLSRLERLASTSTSLSSATARLPSPPRMSRSLARIPSLRYRPPSPPARLPTPPPMSRIAPTIPGLRFSLDISPPSPATASPTSPRRTLLDLDLGTGQGLLGSDDELYDPLPPSSSSSRNRNNDWRDSGQSSLWEEETGGSAGGGMSSVWDSSSTLGDFGDAQLPVREAPRRPAGQRRASESARERYAPLDFDWLSDPAEEDLRRARDLLAEQERVRGTGSGLLDGPANLLRRTVGLYERQRNIIAEQERQRQVENSLARTIDLLTEERESGERNNEISLSERIYRLSQQRRTRELEQERRAAIAEEIAATRRRSRSRSVSRPGASNSLMAETDAELRREWRPSLVDQRPLPVISTAPGLWVDLSSELRRTEPTTSTSGPSHRSSVSLDGGRRIIDEDNLRRRRSRENDEERLARMTSSSYRPPSLSELRRRNSLITEQSERRHPPRLPPPDLGGDISPVLPSPTQDSYVSSTRYARGAGDAMSFSRPAPESYTTMRSRYPARGTSHDDHPMVHTHLPIPSHFTSASSSLDLDSFAPGHFRTTLQLLRQRQERERERQREMERERERELQQAPRIPPLPFDEDRGEVGGRSPGFPHYAPDGNVNQERRGLPQMRPYLSRRFTPQPPSPGQESERVHEVLNRHATARLETTNAPRLPPRGESGFNQAMETLRQDGLSPWRQRQLTDLFNASASTSSSSPSSASAPWGETRNATPSGRPYSFASMYRRYVRNLPDHASPGYLDLYTGENAPFGLLGNPPRRGANNQPGRFSLGDFMPDSMFDSSYEGLLNLAETLGEAKPRSTPSHVIAGLPTGFYKDWKVEDSEERCPICLDDYKLLDPVMKLPECSHWLHKGCLEQWLKGASTCPVCRECVTTSRHGPSSSSSSLPFRGSMRRRASSTSRFVALRSAEVLEAAVPSTSTNPATRREGQQTNGTQDDGSGARRRDRQEELEEDDGWVRWSPRI